MKIIFRGFWSLFLLLTGIITNAQLSTPQILSSNMVLQQGCEVPVWGVAQPKERIQVLFGKQRVNVRADERGCWKVVLQPMKADKTPRQLTIKGEKTSIVYDNIVIGEVWLCSGQSNMEYKMKLPSKYALPAKGKDLAALELEKPTNEMIRVYVTRRDNQPSGWKVADSESLVHVSAVGYFFGKTIQERLDVPVGIITSSVGGTRIEAWTSAEAYENSPVFGSELKLNGGKLDGMAPGRWYNKMISPLAPFALKGFLWYQGESNIICGIPERRYAEKYQVLVDSWRKEFNVTDAPFYSVLLAPYLYSARKAKEGIPSTAEELPLFREQQIKTRSLIPNSDFVVISDLVDNMHDIHPSYKWKVGDRLARLALAKDYGFTDVVWSGPRMDMAEIISDTIILSFKHVADGLKASDKKRLNWFEIAAEDGIFRPALADIRDKDKVVVWHPEIKHPVKVRLGWHETAVPNLVNSEGIPAVPFSGTW